MQIYDNAGDLKWYFYGLLCHFDDFVSLLTILSMDVQLLNVHRVSLYLIYFYV